jgi:hypothetical protein
MEEEAGVMEEAGAMVEVGAVVVVLAGAALAWDSPPGRSSVPPLLHRIIAEATDARTAMAMASGAATVAAITVMGTPR